MIPPISYFGGKQRIAKRIADLLPPHTVYVEPFCGSAAVMYAKGLPEITNNNHYREVINDHDERLVNFYRVLQDDVLSGRLFDRLQFTLFSKAEHQKAKDHVYGGDAVGDAWCYFLALMCSFCNIFNGSFRQGSLLSKNEAKLFDVKKKALPLHIERLRYCTVNCSDAIELIERCDREWTCFYCDPPYPGTSVDGYSGSYTQADFERLVKTLENCKGSVVLSHYPNDAIDPEKWKQHKIKTVCSVANENKCDKNWQKERTEVVSIIDRHKTVKQACPELWPVLWSPATGKLYGKDKRAKQIGLFDDN